MSGLNAQLSPLILPAETEFPGTPQALLQLISEYEAITGLENFTGVTYGSAEPSADNRDLAWFRTDGGGNPIGWYGWDGSAWVPLPQVMPSGATGDRPSAPSDGTQYFDTSINTALIYYSGSWHTLDGSPGDVKFVTGVSLATVLSNNPGWSHYTDGIGRVLAGAAADGSDAETDAGTDSFVMSENQMPAHTHEDIVVTGSEADNGDDGTLTVMAATQSLGQKTVTNSHTGPKGGTDAIDIRQLTRYLFCISKD